MHYLECPHCQAKGIPNLWHYSPFLGQLRYARTQHICRICGGVMYETGGSITLFGWFVILFFIAFAGLLSLGLSFPDKNYGVIFAGFCWNAFCALALYRGYRFIKNKWFK